MIKLVVLSLLVAVVVGSGGWWMAAGKSPEWRGEVVWLAGGVNVIACWLAFVPLAVVRRKRAAFVPQAALAATVIRLLLVASVTLAAIRLEWWPFWPLAVWVTAFYLSLLVVETVLVVRLIHEVCTPEGQVRAA